MDFSFRHWLEADVEQTDNPVADAEAEKAIQSMGDKVKQAVQSGKDVEAEVQKAGTDAVKTVTDNAAKSGGDLGALGKVTKGIKSVQATSTQPGQPAKPMMMKKK